MTALPESNPPVVVSFPKPGVALVTLNRPQQLNAINRAVLVSLKGTLAELEQRGDIMVVLVTGAGEKAFAAGADIKELQSSTAAEAQELSQCGQDVFATLWSMPLLTVAVVRGFALGGGFELALGCNVIFASSDAQFGLPEVSLGLVPGFGGTQRLAQRLGSSRALQWICSGQRVGALEALKQGVVNAVWEPDALMNETLAWCTRVTSQGPRAVKRAKNLVLQGSNEIQSTALRAENKTFFDCFLDSESQEGIAAFLEKRKPQFNLGS